MMRERNRKIVILLGAVACGISACHRVDGGAPNVVNTGQPDPAMPVDHPPLPPLELASNSSQAQRLTVQQLRLTYPAVLGADATGKPITWRLGDGRVGLDVMARPMGEPDYIYTTDEVLEPSPLYTKFVDDAARNVCDQTLKADATAAPGKRVLTRKWCETTCAT
jgi:hypothetical protein